MIDLMSVIAVQGVGLIATVATVAAVSRGHEKRIDNIERLIAGMIGHELRIEKLERCIEELPRTYVPRSEVQLMLQGLTAVVADTKAAVTDTNSMVKALIYAGGDRDIAKKGLEPK